MMKNLLRAFFNTGIALPVKNIVSSRAVYQSEEIQRVELKLTLESGDTLILEMTPLLCRKTIEELKIAYLAINPPLTGGQGAAGWQGMG